MFKRSIALTVALAAALSSATVLTAVSARPAGALPNLFQDTTVFSGRYEPTTIQFAPDGKVFISEKSGRVWRYDSVTDPTAHLVADLRTEVYDFWDKGMLGLAIDPNFGPARPYIYVQYSYDHMLGDPSPAPKWGPGDGTNDPCPSPTVNGCVTSGRVSKLTLSSPGGTVTNEQVLVEDWCAQFPSHTIGTIAFGADGMLYAGGGEGADFNATDYGQNGGTGNGIPANPCGDPPGGVGHANSAPSAQGGALRSQAERLHAKESASVNGGKTTLDGSIIRINPDTGLGVSGNPLFNTPGADVNEQRLVAYGLRNPFRFSFRAGTNEMWLGDVGWDAWEEINTLPDPTISGTLKNFGWPCYEGNGHQPGYDSLNLTACNNLYSAGASAVQAPYFSYFHAANLVPGDNCGSGSSATTGEAYYNPPSGPGASPFPSKYNGALFFTDYIRKCIWAMLPGAGGKPDPNNIELFANIADPANPSNSTGAVDLVESNTGDLYYVSLDTGEIHRIRYTAANHPPVASFTATPSFGAAPLNVAFDASASSDPDPGDTLTYAWDLDGNGVYNDATGVSTSRTYPAGNVTVGLQVTDSHGATATTTRTITPGDTPPTATITTPSAGLTWKVGDPIAFSGSATDAESGSLPASSLSWDVNLLTCDALGSDCVIRSNQPFNGVSSGTVVAPDWSGEGNTLLEFRLTATDPGGLTDVKTLRLTPQKVTLTFQSNPSGLSLGYGSTVGTTPFTRTVIVNSNTSISAPSPQSLGASSYQFTSWSDGGATSHNLTVPATATTYTATYTNVGSSGLVAAYGFEAGSGTSVLDSSGNGNTGTAANTTWSTAGKFGKALSFNGTNAWVTVPDSNSLDLTTGMTLEAWLNPTTSTGWVDAFGKETTDDVVYAIYSSQPANHPTGYIRKGGVFSEASALSPLTLNSWTHVATTYDGATLRFYVNGIQTGSSAATGAIDTSSGVLRIGGNSIFGEYFNGLIDEVRIYNRALTAAQITTDMNTAVAPAVTDTQPPSAPGTLSATGGLGAASLSWGAANDNVGVVRYDVYRSTTSGFTPSVANRVAQPTGLTYNDAGLGAGTYYYRVSAEDAAGNIGPPTNEASAVVTADTTAPTVALTAPTGGTVSGTVTVSATANDNVGVAGVQFKVDTTTNIGAEDTTTPYSVSWASTGVSNGTHTLTAVARDAAGNTTTSAPVTVTVNNTGPAGLVAAYGFEAGSGTSVLDSSGNGNTGTAANTTWSTAGKFGKALSFNGTNAWVTVPDSNSLDLTTGMTLEAWLNPTTSTGWLDAFGKETTDDVVYAIYSSQPANHPTGYIRKGGVFSEASALSPLTLNSWTHVATTYDGATLRFYVNGIQTGSSAATGAIDTSSGVLRIGGNSIFGEYFNGLIDEVRIYNRALTAAQITTDMNTAVAPAVTDTQPPSAPGTLSATGGLGAASLSWGAANDNVGVVRYDVYRSTTSGFTPSVANRVAQPTGLTYNDAGLGAGTYYYRVSAEDAAGNIGPPTNEASAVVTADTTAPTVALTAPTGGTVSGTVTVSATANDNVGVAGVQFKVDTTTNIGAEDTATPYSVSWASTGVSNGTHTLTAVARDAAGNTTTSAPVTVTVNNTGPAGLVAAYGFEAGSGTSVLDSSGNGNTGTAANTTWSTAGKFGKALSFNGTNAWVTVPDSNSLDLTTGMTLEAWLNPTTSTGWVDAFGKETTDDVVYAIYSSQPANHPTGYIRKGGLFSEASALSPLTLNSWTHVATTYDGATLRFYVNGIQTGSSAATGAIDTSSGVLRIGGNSIFGEYFNGLIDEVRIYNRALTAAQITTDMNTPV